MDYSFRPKKINWTDLLDGNIVMVVVKILSCSRSAPGAGDQAWGGGGGAGGGVGGAPVQSYRRSGRHWSR